MRRLVVSEICPYRLFRADGERLRAAIVAAWSDDEPVEIDFEDERIASASFLDESIGVLALTHPLEVLKARLRPVNLTKPDRGLLNQILSRRSAEREAPSVAADQRRAAPARR
jgi:hypothetical protein